VNDEANRTSHPTNTLAGIGYGVIVKKTLEEIVNTTKWIASLIRLAEACTEFGFRNIHEFENLVRELDCDVLVGREGCQYVDAGLFEIRYNAERARAIRNTPIEPLGLSRGEKKAFSIRERMRQLEANVSGRCSDLAMYRRQVDLGESNILPEIQERRVREAEAEIASANIEIRRLQGELDSLIAKYGHAASKATKAGAARSNTKVGLNFDLEDDGLK
jgi:hypothetical protein